MQAQAFLKRHAPRVIEITKNLDTSLPDDSDINQFLERVYADFDTVADKPGRRASLPGEDVFWWCITILEELDEMARPTATEDPYLAMMLDQLRSMGTRLANGEPLPPRFGIHWFDDLDDEDADD